MLCIGDESSPKEHPAGAPMLEKHHGDFPRNAPMLASGIDGKSVFTISKIVKSSIRLVN
jgi:hypothetical protein